MPINALIAQGVRPIGDELIGVQQTVNRNALANREMVNREADLGFDKQRYADAQARLAEQDAAAAGQAKELDVRRTIEGAIKYVNENPASLGNVIGDLTSKGIINGVNPEGLTVQAVNEWAAKNGFPVPQAAKPFDQGDKAAELRMKYEFDSKLAAQRAAQDAAAAARTVPEGGKPPPGYRFKPDGNLEAIPGGPADKPAPAVNSAWSMYKEARAGLVGGLSETSTGYIQGKMPTITAGQQVAEGSVAAMAPVLKQIFRVSGEGTFTDKDQALLLSMVPTRNDLEEARNKKLAVIDRIIKAKLGVPPEESVDGSAPTGFDEAAYNALPSGAEYTGPDGKKRKKR